jgi:hypothetical protein
MKTTKFETNLDERLKRNHSYLAPFSSRFQYNIQERKARVSSIDYRGLVNVPCAWSVLGQILLVVYDLDSPLIIQEEPSALCPLVNCSNTLHIVTSGKSNTPVSNDINRKLWPNLNDFYAI